MKENNTYNELKEEYKREFDRVIKEMEEFRDNTDDFDNIKEFEVPLPPRYLIDKRLKTKTYLVHSIGFESKFTCCDPFFRKKPYCLNFPEGCVKKKNKKIEFLIKYLWLFIPDRLLNRIYDICLGNNDIVLKTLSERKEMKQKDKVIKKLVRYDGKKIRKKLHKPSKIYNNLTIFDRILWWYWIKRYGGIKSYQLNYPNTDDNNMNKKNQINRH